MPEVVFVENGVQSTVSWHPNGVTLCRLGYLQFSRAPMETYSTSKSSMRRSSCAIAYWTDQPSRILPYPIADHERDFWSTSLRSVKASLTPSLTLAVRDPADRKKEKFNRDSAPGGVSPKGPDRPDRGLSDRRTVTRQRSWREPCAPDCRLRTNRAGRHDGIRLAAVSTAANARSSAKSSLDKSPAVYAADRMRGPRPSPKARPGLTNTCR